MASIRNFKQLLWKQWSEFNEKYVARGHGQFVLLTENVNKI